MNALTDQTKGMKLAEWVAKPDVRKRVGDALGASLPVDLFLCQMLIALQTPALDQCTFTSKVGAILDCATLGLLPTLRQVALIPYKDAVKVMPEWRGFKALMERHPDVLEVEATLVHVRDTYGWEKGEFSHVYDPLDESRVFSSINDCRGGYLRILYRTGRVPKYHFVTKWEIQTAQNCAREKSVWKTFWYPMGLKTLYRTAYSRGAVGMDPLAQGTMERLLEKDNDLMGNDPAAYARAPIGMSRNLRSSEAPRLEYAPKESQGEDWSAAYDVWKARIDAIVQVTDKSKLAVALEAIQQDLDQPGLDMQENDRVQIRKYLMAHGLSVETVERGELE